MKFKKIDKLILFGGSYLMASIIRKFNSLDYQLVVFSAPRHLDEKIGNTTLRHLLKKYKVRFFEATNINQYKSLKSEITPTSLGIAIGAAWTFSPNSLKLFSKNHLLDFMGIDLPRYRGGAHYTWQILHQNRQAAANLQIIQDDQSLFHRGPIISRLVYTLPAKLTTPSHYFNYIIKKEITFLLDFLRQVNQAANFKISRLDEIHSSYYPMLSTQTHGLINWRWSGHDIYLFINAFGEPYAGASTYLNNKKVFLQDCQFIKPQEKYHPFSSGLVIRKNKQGVFIVTLGNLLIIKKIINASGKNVISQVVLGDRFYTPYAKLDAAMLFKAVYTAQGLKI